MFELRGKLLVLAAVFAAAGFGIFGDTSTRAQQNSLATAATPTPTPTPEETDEVYKVDTQVVNVLFTAEDRNRKLILNLKPEDVRLIENGQEQKFSSFSRQIDL